MRTIACCHSLRVTNFSFLMFFVVLRSFNFLCFLNTWVAQFICAPGVIDLIKLQNDWE
jgi:hypothetical protein